MKTGAKRNYTFYVLMLLIFGGLFWMVIREGKLWDRAFDKTHREAVEMVSGHVAVQQAPASCPAPLELFTQSLHEGVHHPVAMLLLQIISILVAVRIFSWLFKYLGQPGVIGEIVAGIVLGPSLLGHFFPETFGFLFAPDSLESLNILSQIGLILFMFIIGMELDLGILRKKGSQTLVISHASIIVPFFLGTVLAWQVYPEFGFGHTTFVPFALFIGISVSITAFPVLARIIQERQNADGHAGDRQRGEQRYYRMVPAGRDHCDRKGGQRCQRRLYVAVRDPVCAVHVRAREALHAQAR